MKNCVRIDYLFDEMTIDFMLESIDFKHTAQCECACCFKKFPQTPL